MKERANSRSPSARGLVVAAGILASPWLVRLYAEGFSATPGKLETTVLMNRIMFPYLLLISLAALLQAVLNSHEKFLLAASTPMFYNLTIAGTAWWVLPRVANPAPVLSAAFSPDGAEILTGSDDETVMLWDATTGEPIWVLRAHATAVASVGFSPGGEWAMSAETAGVLVFTHVGPGEPVLGLVTDNDNAWIWGSGGIYLRNGGDVDLCTVTLNTGGAGAIYASPGTITDCVITDNDNINTSSAHGGGMYLNGAAATRCTVVGNGDPRYGGGVAISARSRGSGAAAVGIVSAAQLENTSASDSHRAA